MTVKLKHVGDLGSTRSFLHPLAAAAAVCGHRNANMGKKHKNRSGKEIVFDENARKEFLTGFRKRKNERRQHARQKIAEEVRREKLAERQERREHMREIRGYGQISDDDGSADDDDDQDDASKQLSKFPRSSGWRAEKAKPAKKKRSMPASSLRFSRAKGTSSGMCE